MPRCRSFHTFSLTFWVFPSFFSVTGQSIKQGKELGRKYWIYGRMPCWWSNYEQTSVFLYLINPGIHYVSLHPTSVCSQKRNMHENFNLWKNWKRNGRICWKGCQAISCGIALNNRGHICSGVYIGKEGMLNYHISCTPRIYIFSIFENWEIYTK